MSLAEMARVNITQQDQIEIKELFRAQGKLFKVGASGHPGDLAVSLKEKTGKLHPLFPQQHRFQILELPAGGLVEEEDTITEGQELFMIVPGEGDHPRAVAAKRAAFAEAAKKTGVCPNRSNYVARFHFPLQVTLG